MCLYCLCAVACGCVASQQFKLWRDLDLEKIQKPKFFFFRSINAFLASSVAYACTDVCVQSVHAKGNKRVLPLSTAFVLTLKNYESVEPNHPDY